MSFVLAEIIIFSLFVFLIFLQIKQVSKKKVIISLILLITMFISIICFYYFQIKMRTHTDPMAGSSLYSGYVIVSFLVFCVAVMLNGALWVIIVIDQKTRIQMGDEL